MRLIRSAGSRRVVTVLLTLSLLVISQQRVRANHVYLIAAEFAAIGAAVGAAVWFVMRKGDDPADPSTPDPPPASTSTRWRSLPAMAQTVFDKQFGVQFQRGNASATLTTRCGTNRAARPLQPVCGNAR